MITDVKPGQRIILRRDKNYWAKDLPVRRGLYNFDEIDIEYFRDANSLFEAFAAGLLDFREETNPARWTNSYDFPAIRDHRMIREALPAGGPKGMEGFVFNLRRPLFARHQGSRGAGAPVRFRMDQCQSLQWALQANEKLFRRFRTCLDRAPGERRRACLACALSGRGARGYFGRQLAAGRDRRFGRRQDRAKARPRALERGRLRNRRRPSDQRRASLCPSRSW